MEKYLLLSIVVTIVLGLNTNGKTYNEIKIREEKRKFLLYFPKKFTKNKLWIGLHGNPGSAKYFFHNTDFFLVAEDKGFPLLILQARCVVSYFCYWNTGLFRSLFDTNWDKDDIEYIDTVIETFFEFSGFNESLTEIVITGFSGGAFMAFTYAINTTIHKIHTVIGVAGHIGGNSHPWFKPSRIYDPNLFGIQGENLFNVISVLGENDTVIEIRGGEYYFSVEQDAEFFLKENDCLNSTEEYYYDMNETLTLTNYGKNVCLKRIMSVIASGIDHNWRNYDKLFQNESLVKNTFAKYSKTLAEFLYNLVEYEINNIPLPNSDPDPWIPSDGYYPKWFDFFPVYREGGDGAYYSITEGIIIIGSVSTLIFLYMYGFIVIMLLCKKCTNSNCEFPKSQKRTLFFFTGINRN